MPSPHHLLFLDFETYYDDDYTLKKLTPPEYILDPRYETIGMAAADGGEIPHWVDGPDVSKYLSQFDPAHTTTVTFNALFDNCILAWKYGFIPARMLCAMRMAVALRGHVLRSASLASVSESLGVGKKGDTVANVKGLRRSQIMNNPGLWRAYQAYSCNDDELCRSIFFKLAPEFPTSERRVMDMVLRCAVAPRFKIDLPMLKEHLDDLHAQKVRMLRLAAGAKEEDLDNAGLALNDEADIDIESIARSLRSNDRFSELLIERGVDIEYKPSVSDPTREIPAFAKTDSFMSELLEHPDPAVQALASARLGVRSTIEESRGKRMLAIGSLPWQSTTAWGNFPVPLRYAGAHTHRLAGEWKINPQNFPSGRGKQKSKLRKSLRCRDDEEVVAADLSQIECRITAWLCGQRDLLAEFAAHGDPYSTLASKIFGFKVDKKIHLIERFIGKSGVLGLGFGCGDKKFYNMVVRAARTLGMDMTKLLAVWTPQLAEQSVRIYRGTNLGIVQAWGTLDQILKTAWVGLSGPRKWGPVVIGKGYVDLPNGLRMLYDVTSTEPDDLRYRYGKHEHRMYGPKFLENIVQALARIVVMNAALRIADRGFQFALQEHDALAFVVKKADAARCKEIVLEEMRRPPSWAKILPLDAECGSGPSYGEAK